MLTDKQIQQIHQLNERGLPPSKIAVRVGCSIPSVRKHLETYEEEDSDESPPPPPQERSLSRPPSGYDPYARVREKHAKLEETKLHTEQLKAEAEIQEIHERRAARQAEQERVRRAELQEQQRRREQEESNRELQLERLRLEERKLEAQRARESQEREEKKKKEEAEWWRRLRLKTGLYRCSSCEIQYRVHEEENPKCLRCGRGLVEA
jgi:hypothetical protein